MLHVLVVPEVQLGLAVQQCSLFRIWSWMVVPVVPEVREVLVGRIPGLQVNQAPQEAPGVPSESLL